MDTQRSASGGETGAQARTSGVHRSTWRRLQLLIALLTSLVLVLAACGDGGDGEDEGDGGGGAGEEETGGEEEGGESLEFDLTYGVLMSLTGDLAPYGEPGNEAALLAVDLINEALESTGQSGVTVSAVTEDDQTQASAATEAATKLVQTDGASVIVGALASDATIPVAESVTIPNQVVQISPASTSPAITDIADDGYLWRTPPSDAFQSLVLAEQMAAEFGADATVNVGTRNDAYGTALAEAFETAWTDGGGTVGESVAWNPDAATFDTEAGQLAGGEPDAWLIIDFPETFNQFGPALVRAGGWDPARTFMTDGLRDTGLPESAGEEATEGARGTAPASVGDAADAFDAVWSEQVDVDRQLYDAQSFDAVMVSFLAAVAANSADPADIRDNLQAVSAPEGDQYTFEELDQAIEALAAGEDVDYEGPSGPVNFDENGDISAAFYEVWGFEGGELTTLDTVEFSVEE